MSLGSKKVVRIGQNFNSGRGMHNHMLVHLRPKTELSIMVGTPDQGLHIHRVVWCKEVVSLIPDPGLVEITLTYVMKAPRVVSSVFRPYIT